MNIRRRRSRECSSSIFLAHFSQENKSSTIIDSKGCNLSNNLVLLKLQDLELALDLDRLHRPFKNAVNL